MADPDESASRLLIVGIVVISLFASLFLRLGYLQLFPDNGYQVRADGVNIRVIHEEGTRGRILDRNGKVLVDNRVSIVVGLERPLMTDLDDVTRTAMFDRLAAELTRFGFPTKSGGIASRYDDKRYGPLERVPLVSDLPPGKPPPVV